MFDGVRFYWALCACSALATGFAVYRLFASLTRDRFVTDTPLVRIRSAAQGYARIEGRAGVDGAEVLAAPLSGRPCVWWDYKIAVKETDSRGNTSWEVCERATSVAPFSLSDSDGTCLIGPVGAEVTPTSTDTWYGDSQRPVAGPPQLGFIAELDHTYRYTERLLAPGVRLSVLGELRSHAEERELDEDTRTLLDSWKADQPQLLARFDADRNGRIDAQEWETVRAAAAAQAQKQADNSRIQRTSVVAQPTHGQPFLIAPLDGAQLAHRERRNAWLFLVGAVLLLVLTVWSIDKLRVLEHAALAASGSASY
ncbi:MAG: hypothetical protein JSR36_06100 [Proteobacteria bacterium]|nr:hypothetical protein [Pseudomonadota bacterium]